MANHNLNAAQLAVLDQAHRDAEADLDDLLTDPVIPQALAEDGAAVAFARLTLTLQERFAHIGCAGLAALAIGRLIAQRDLLAAARVDAAALIQQIRDGHDQTLPAAGVAGPAAPAWGSASGPRTPGHPQADDPATWPRLVQPAPTQDPALREDHP